jgi:hypothetical protein
MDVSGQLYFPATYLRAKSPRHPLDGTGIGPNISSKIRHAAMSLSFNTM